MAGSLNSVCLVGCIGKYGVDLRYHTNGTPYASFVLALVEGTPEGKYFTTLVPCEVWGKKAEAATELEPGQFVAFSGRLSRRKQQKSDDRAQSWDLCVSGFDVMPIVLPVPTVAANN